MTRRDTKLYPTPDNCQRDVDGATGAPIDRLVWWIDYLQVLLAKIPPEEQADARIVFTASGPQVWYPHLLSPMEELQDKLLDKVATLRDIRDRILADGQVDADELKWLAEKLAGL